MTGARIIDIAGIEPEQGHAWLARLPDWISPGDGEADNLASPVRLFEDGTELLPGHAPHALIRSGGGGRFSHWHRALWFSTSDNSDPRDNGRRYQILLPAPDAGPLHRLESEMLALGGDANDLDRHRLLRRLASTVYPAYTLSDHGRLIDRAEAFFVDMKRILQTGDVVHDRRFGLAEFARIATTVPGDLAEVGCYKGAGAFAIARTLESLGIRRTIHLFDSFAGLSKVEAVDGTAWNEHDLACDLATTQANLDAFDVFEIWPGWIPERFPEVADRAFALVHIDVDLHRPTLQSLEFFYPRVAPGGLIVLDDYGFDTCPGVTQAADDFFADKPESIINLVSGGALVIKAGRAE